MFRVHTIGAQLCRTSNVLQYGATQSRVRVPNLKVVSRFSTSAARTTTADLPQTRLVDLLSQLDQDKESIPDDPNRTILYQCHKPWKFRGLTSLAFVQSIYWSYIAYESAQRIFMGKPSPFEASPDSLVVMVFTHPAWGVVGATLSVGMIAAAHFYATHYISQLSLVKTPSGDRVELLFHSMLGAPCQGVTVKPEDIRVPAVSTGALSGNSIPLEVGGFKARVMIDSGGNYAQNLTVYEKPEHNGQSSTSTENDKETAEQKVATVLKIDNEESFYRLVQYLGIPSVRAKSIKHDQGSISPTSEGSEFYATIESVTETHGSVMQRKLGKKRSRRART